MVTSFPSRRSTLEFGTTPPHGGTLPDRGCCLEAELLAVRDSRGWFLWQPSRTPFGGPAPPSLFGDPCRGVSFQAFWPLHSTCSRSFPWMFHLLPGPGRGWSGSLVPPPKILLSVVLLKRRIGLVSRAGTGPFGQLVGEMFSAWNVPPFLPPLGPSPRLSPEVDPRSCPERARVFFCEPVNTLNVLHGRIREQSTSFLLGPFFWFPENLQFNNVAFFF